MDTRAGAAQEARGFIEKMLLRAADKGSISHLDAQAALGRIRIVDTLADFVWGDQESTNRRTLVQVYVSYVRKKLAVSAQVAIRFTRGVGYEFTPLSDNDGPGART